MPNPKELGIPGAGGEPPKETSGSKRKEILPYEVVGRISRNIEIDQEGEYHVWWGEGEERRHHGPFATIQEVMNQHERVAMGYLGWRIPLPIRIGKTFVSHGKEFLEMKGESQEMAEIGNGLLSLMKEFPTLKTRADRQRLETRLGGLKYKIGAARNIYKQAAAVALETAIVSPMPGRKMEKTGEAAKDIFQRAQETINKAEGTIQRWNLCEKKRDDWEKILLEIFRGLVGFKKLADEGKLDDKKKREMARRVCGKSRGQLKGSHVEFLSLITGQPYKERAEDQRLRRLAKIEDYLTSGNDEALQRTLKGAIDCLWRVWDNRRVRLEGEKKEYLRRELES